MRQRHNSNKDADKQKSEALTSSKSGSEHSPFCCSHKRIFLLCLAFRMVNSVLVQTYFNPDEHWQGPEVAHRVAFGYGSINFHSIFPLNLRLFLRRWHVNADLAGTVT